MARKRKQYDPAKDNPLLEYTPLLIAGAVTGVAGIGYAVYKMSQPSAAAAAAAATAKSTASKTATTSKAPTLSKMPTKVITTPSATTSNPDTSTPAATILSSGQTMNPGDYLVSPNGTYQLIFQTDGNLVLYQGSAGSYTNAVWSTSTQGKGATTVVMQTDGNCVLYVGTAAAWATNTAGNPGAYLAVQDSGILTVYTAANLVTYDSYNALWSSNWPQ
jgi:hypothetical protein